MKNPRKALILLLTLGGCVMLTAALAVVLPTPWMAATHRWLGLGHFPRSPLVEYLTRSLSALYAFHGGILLLAASDVARFAPLVRYLGHATLVVGATLLMIDLYAGLPPAWIAIEGPSVMFIGLAIIRLLRASGLR